MAKGCHPDPPDFHSATVDVWISPAILMRLSSTAAAFLPFFPFRRPAGAAPATISGGLLCTDHAFVVSILFAFTCSFSAVFLERKPQAARVFRLSAIMWLSSAFVLLLYAVYFNSKGHTP